MSQSTNKKSISHLKRRSWKLDKFTKRWWLAFMTLSKPFKRWQTSIILLTKWDCLMLTSPNKKRKLQWRIREECALMQVHFPQWMDKVTMNNKKSRKRFLFHHRDKNQRHQAQDHLVSKIYYSKPQSNLTSLSTNTAPTINTSK